MLRDRYYYAVGRGRNEAIREQSFRKCTIEARQNEKWFGSWEWLYLLAEKMIGGKHFENDHLVGEQRPRKTERKIRTSS
jgi:hypothetical protein